MPKRIFRLLALVGVGMFFGGIFLGDTSVIIIGTILVGIGVIWG